MKGIRTILLAASTAMAVSTTQSRCECPCERTAPPTQSAALTPDLAAWYGLPAPVWATQVAMRQTLADQPKPVRVCIFRGFRASGQSSEASIDGLKAAIEADPTIGKTAVVQLFDPGTGGSVDGPDGATRFLAAAAAGEKVVIIGHSHGGHRGYLFARKPPTPNGKLDMFIAVDPIDFGRCKNILTCAGYGKADQSGIVEAAIDDVPWVDIVQRDPGATNFLKGYRIGKNAEAECPLVKLTDGTMAFMPPLNSTCFVPNPTGHSDVAKDARVYRGIIELLKGVAIAPSPPGLGGWTVN